MNTSLVAKENPTLWTPSTISSANSRIGACIEAMMKAEAHGLNERSALMPLDDLRDIVAAIDARSQRPTIEEATGAAKQLMGFFKASAFVDPPMFVKGLTALLGSYDLDFVRRVCSPVDGLATRTKFALTLAEVKGAIEEQKADRLKIRLTALWMIAEHKRRQEAKEEEARWNFSPEELERRRLQAAELLRVQAIGGER